MTKKMTYSTALATAIEILGNEGANAEVIEKLTALKASVDKKNAAPNALTAQQKKNEGLKQIIADFLANTPDKGYTVSELLKEIPELEGDSNQHISALLRQLYLAKVIKKYTEKRRTYFKIKTEEVE